MSRGLTTAEYQVLTTIAENDGLSRAELRRIRIDEQWERPVSDVWEWMNRSFFRIRGKTRHAEILDQDLIHLEDKGYIARNVSYEKELDESFDAFMLTSQAHEYLYDELPGKPHLYAV